MQSDGTEIVGLGQAGFPDYLRQDLQKWKRAVELSGAKVDCQRVPAGGLQTASTLMFCAATTFCQPVKSCARKRPSDCAPWAEGSMASS